MLDGSNSRTVQGSDNYNSKISNLSSHKENI